MKLSKRKTITAGIAVLVTGFSLLVWIDPLKTTSIVVHKETFPIENLKTTEIPFDGAIDVHNQKEVAKYADVAFVGETASPSKSAERSGMPWTTWTVECRKILKGDLPCSSIFKIEQQGGIIGDTTTLFQGDNLLISGRFYLFACKSTKSGQLTIIPIGGSNLIDSADFIAIVSGKMPSPRIAEILKEYN